MVEKFLRLIFSTFWEEFFKAASKPTQYYRETTDENDATIHDDLRERLLRHIQTNPESEYSPSNITGTNDQNTRAN